MREIHSVPTKSLYVAPILSVLGRLTVVTAGSKNNGTDANGTKTLN